MTYFFRQYEEREVRFQQEKVKKLLEFDNQIEKLEGELTYHRDDDKQGKIFTRMVHIWVFDKNGQHF